MMQNTAFKITRLALGAFMVIIGLNKFVGFIEIPHPPGMGGKLMDIYMASGFLRLIGAMQMAAGIGLIINKFVPLALSFITAIMFNASVFHALYDPAGIGAAAICLVLSLVLVYAYKGRFSAIFRA